MKCLEQFCRLKLPSPNIVRADVPNPVPNHSDPIQLPNFLLLDLTEEHNMCKNHHLPPPGSLPALPLTNFKTTS